MQLEIAARQLRRRHGGGKLQLVAEFRNRHPVAIALADIAGAAPLKPTRRIRAGLPAA